MIRPEDGRENGIPPQELRRIISLPWLILYGLGATVGAGIYALTGVVAGRAGFLAPLAFGFAALLALCTGLSFAELSARFPKAGGALVYVREGLGSRSLSTGVGLLSALSAIVSAATVSLGFVGYLSKVLSISPTTALIVVIAAVGGLAAWGVRESVIAAGVVTLVEVLGLLAIVAFGTVHLSHQQVDVSRLIPTQLVEGQAVALMSATVLGFFAFLGFEDMVNVAEEVKNPTRTLPRAILWTLGLATTLYVVVASIAVLVVSPEELGPSGAPLSLVFERSGGSGELLALIALAAMLNGALVQVIMASRILFSLSRSGSLPRILSRVHPTRRTPILATLCVSSLVAIFAFTLPLEALASATAAIALAVFTVVNFSLFILRMRIRHVEAGSIYTVPIWVPILGSTFSLSLFLFELSSRLGFGS